MGGFSVVRCDCIGLTKAASEYSGQQTAGNAGTTYFLPPLHILVCQRGHRPGGASAGTQIGIQLIIADRVISVAAREYVRKAPHESADRMADCRRQLCVPMFQHTRPSNAKTSSTTRSAEPEHAIEKYVVRDRYSAIIFP